MKRILILLWFIPALLIGQSYYHFSNAGDDDTGDGSIGDPYASIDKANTLVLSGDDSVVFKAGDTFYGTLTMSYSGTSGHPIVYGKYWTGDDPIITGLTTLTDWVDEGDGTFSKAITSQAQTNMVLVDGVQVAMGRYPNTGTTLTYESHSTNVSITDNQLTGDWAGGEIVISPSKWILNRASINSQVGTTITYTNLVGSNPTPEDGRYYFIQNAKATLDAENEWYHDHSGTTIYVYGDPAAKTIQVATRNRIISNNGFDYITFDNLDLRGSIERAVYCYGTTDNITFQDCSLSFAGQDGIYIAGSDQLIDGNTISDINQGGIVFGGGNDGVCTNNTITDIGMLIGQGWRGAYADGVYCSGTDATINYNTITNTCDEGVDGASGNVISIGYNLIMNPCMYIEDSGGIYFSGALGGTRTVQYNTVIGSLTRYLAGAVIVGIYLDEGASNVNVQYNTVANTYYGIQLHKASSNTVQNNNFYNHNYGIFLNAVSTAGSVTGNVIDHNIVVIKASSPYWSYLTTRAASPGNDIAGMGTINNNIYARPVDDNVKINYNQPSTGSTYATLAQWVSFSGHDAATTGSPTGVADSTKIDFYYNATAAPVLIDLTVAMVDMEGRKIAAVTDTTLAAWRSVILLEDPDPDPDPPDLPTVTTTDEDSWTYNSVAAYGGGNVTSDGDGTVSARGIVWNTTGSPTTSDSKTSNGTGTGAFTSKAIPLNNSTTYYIKAYATNETGTAYGAEIIIITTESSVVTSGGVVVTSGSNPVMK